MRTSVSLFLAMVVPFALAEEKKPDTLTLRGKVVDADGKPVTGAVVDVRGEMVGRDQATRDLQDVDDLLTTTKTDAAGEFAFKDVALPKSIQSFRTPYYLLARAPGHGVGWKTLRQTPEDVVEVKLAVPAAVRGRIVDEAGKPVADAKIKTQYIWRLGAERDPDARLSSYRIKGKLSTASDADGGFNFADMPKEAKFSLTISHDRYVIAGAQAATTDKPQPKEVQRYTNAKGQVVVHEQQVFTGDFTVTLKAGHRVSGRVVFEDTGKPVAGARVDCRGEESGYSRAVTDAEGRFTCQQLALGKGTCTVAAPEKSEYIAATSNFEITAGKTGTLVENVKLPRGAIVAGKVIDEDTGKGISGVTVFYETATGSPRSGSAITDADGSFRLAVAPGPGKLHVVGQIPGYLVQPYPNYRPGPGAADTSSPFTRQITAKLEEPVKDVTFKLGKGLFVSGQVVDADGKPAAGVKLFPFSQWNIRWDTPAATTDAEGRFTLSGLDPAKKHEVIAIHEGRRLAGRFSAQGTKDKKRVEDLKVRVEPQATMTGRVVDEDKKPIAGATVYAYVMMQVEEGGNVYFTSFSPFTDKPVKTDKDGKFTCDYLIPGMQHSASVNQEGYAGSSSAQFTPKGGDRHDVGELRLIKADQSVAGVVVDPAGRPLAGIRVYATSRGGGSAYVSSEQVHTDKEGRFKVDKLPRGGVEINALSESDAQGISMSNRMNAQSGQTDVKLVMFLRRTPPPVDALVGKPAPEFPVANWLHRPMTEKKSFQPADFQGKVVVLAFVDEAKPSQRVLPMLQTLQEKLGDKVVVLRVHEIGEAEELAKLSPLPAAIVSGGIVPGYADAHQKYGARATPTLFLIDKGGILRHADVKPEELEAKVKQLLEG